MTDHTHQTAPTQFVDGAGIRFAYRRFGKNQGVPLVFFQHFTGTMDNLDPAVTDGLDRDREVILFNNAGISSSGGETPNTRATKAAIRNFVLGATDRRLRAVVAQVPTISGFEQGLRRVAPDGIAALERAFAEDDRGQLRGEALRRQLVVSDDLAIPASYHNKDAIDFYLQPTPPGIWENSVTIRSTRAARMYEPGIWVPRVSPTPLLMVVALSDTMTVTDLALAAYQRALEPKRLQLISGGHFAPYLEQFPLAVAAATEWFSEHLLNPGARRVTQVAIQSASAQANSDIANV